MKKKDNVGHYNILIFFEGGSLYGQGIKVPV